MKSLTTLAMAVGLAAATALADHDEPSNEAASGPVEAPAARAVCWLATSLERVFPQSPPSAADLRLLAARNSIIAYQACVRNNSERPLRVTCAADGADVFAPRVRFVGLTPVQHVTLDTPLDELDGGGKYVPGLVPDPLWPKTTAEVCPFESRSFWITLSVPKDAAPGEHSFRVCLTLNEAGEQRVELPVRLTVAPLVLQPRRGFPVTHWWWASSTWEQYKTEMFHERWWQITRAQMENLFAHGNDVAYVPMFAFAFPKAFERPGQMLIVEEGPPGVYRFDWSRVKRFTDMCREIGFRQFEWSHLFMQWSVDQPPLVYKLEQGKHVPLWPIGEPLLSPRYSAFLQQLLPQWKKFLDEERLLPHCYFHLADEPQNLENYRAAREFLRREAPWMRVMDAVQDVAVARQGLTDVPVALLNVSQSYAAAGIPHWVYYCCVPTGRHLNRFMDTPLPKIRMAGWTFYRLQAQGFLHWGYNYWSKLNDDQEQPIDPFTDAAAGASPGIPAGDPFVVYPGPDGRPLDSIRWEVFAESLQDYALLQSAGIRPDDALLAPIKSYEEFPKSQAWLDEARRAILLSAPPAGNGDAPEQPPSHPHRAVAE
ncbi:MAG: hypothetical protein DCC67_15580 [Planctomycetota bacterium]|nr:MAG: hypothetical protein DCC67_15580 [Planctomycetota bacterium]